MLDDSTSKTFELFRGNARRGAARRLRYFDTPSPPPPPPVDTSLVYFAGAGVCARVCEYQEGTLPVPTCSVNKPTSSLTTPGLSLCRVYIAAR